MIKPPASLRPKKKKVKFGVEYGAKECVDMDCSQCCEGAMAVSDESTKPETKSELHPLGDHEMEREDEDAVELGGGDVPGAAELA